MKASNTDAGDTFGYSVALSSDGATLALGADREASAATGVGGAQAGELRRARRRGLCVHAHRDHWARQAYVKASNGDANHFPRPERGALGRRAEGTLLVAARPWRAARPPASTATRPTTPAARPARPMCSRAAGPLGPACLR